MDGNLPGCGKPLDKIPQARLQHYANQEISDVQVGFRKGRGIRDQIANIHFLASIKTPSISGDQHPWAGMDGGVLLAQDITGHM